MCPIEFCSFNPTRVLMNVRMNSPTYYISYTIYEDRIKKSHVQTWQKHQKSRLRVINMQCIVNGSLKQIRPMQLNMVLARNNSALGCTVLEKRLRNNRGLGQPVKKVHQDNFVAPCYVTQKSFVQNMLLQRMKTFFNEDTGVAPTKIQQCFLVLTRMFQNRSQIPDYVASGTMSRMHDRMRVVFIIVATSIFYVFFFAFYRTMAYMVSWNKQRNNFIHLKEQ